MKELARKAGRAGDFFIESAATSREEIGNDIYPPAKAKLRQEGIPFERRAARQIRFDDYEKYDLLVGMDGENIRNMERLWPDTDGKIKKLLSFVGSSRDVADPWYTGDFDATFDDLITGCAALLKSL